MIFGASAIDMRFVQSGVHLPWWRLEESHQEDGSERGASHPGSSHLEFNIDSESILNRERVSELVNVMWHWLENYKLPTGKVRDIKDIIQEEHDWRAFDEENSR